jgi:hypothetical protein
VNGYASKTGNVTNYGVYGLAAGAGSNATGVFGYANAATGLTNGVWGRASSVDGTGVYGLATGSNGFGVFGGGPLVGVWGSGGLFGIFGDSGGAAAIGDGSYGVISNSDLGVGGHLVAAGGDVAGTCTVTASTTQLCTFPHAFPSAPIVNLTPTGNPGGSYWVTATTTDFTITLANSGTVTFNYIVIGTDSNVTPLSASSATNRGAVAARAQR